MMENKMYDSLKSIQSKYNDIQKQLTDPEVVSDIKKYTQLVRESNDMEDIVRAFSKYENFVNTIKDSKEILKTEKDADLLEMAKSEIEEVEKNMPSLEEEIKILLIPKDPNDNKNVIIEIRGAAGGDEANIFAGDLYDIYKK